MKHPVSRELFAYWNTLRKGRTAPERADIDPAAIRGILSDTFIVGAVANREPSAYPIRLSGTRLNALFLEELKGRSIIDLWLDQDRDSVARLFETVLDEAVPLVAGLRGGPAEHRPIELEMLLLPLRHKGRTHARILGTIAPIVVPSWLGLIGVEHLALTSLRLIDTGDTAPVVVKQRVGGGEEIDLAPRRYGRFTVHTGGR